MTNLDSTIISEQTRVARRNVLGASAISIAFATAGFVPIKITALGIEFSETSRKALVWCLIAGVIYFLIAFTVYAVFDYSSLRSQSNEVAIRMAKEDENRANENDDLPASGSQSEGKKYYSTKSTQILLSRRFGFNVTLGYWTTKAYLIFELGVPAAIGLGALVALGLALRNL